MSIRYVTVHLSTKKVDISVENEGSAVLQSKRALALLAVA
jgi:hypothetical protein